MAGMKEIRGHIESIKSTQKVTNAMYLIASTKMRRAKEDLEKTRPFFDALTGEIERIFQRGGEIRSPYVFCGDADDSNQSGTYAYLVVTADRGLAGAYNQNVIQETLGRIKSHSDSRVFVVGDNGRQFLQATAYRWKRTFSTPRRAPRCAAPARSRQSSSTFLTAGDLQALYGLYGL